MLMGHLEGYMMPSCSSGRRFQPHKFKGCFPQVQASCWLSNQRREYAGPCVYKLDMHTRQHSAPTSAVLIIYLSCWCLLTNQDWSVAGQWKNCGNSKAWMTAAVRLLLTAWDAAFRAGDTMTDLLNQVCTFKGNQCCERHLCWENPGTPLWHRKHQADVAGSPSADGLQVQAGGQQQWCFSSRQAQNLLCTLWSTKPNNQRGGWSLSNIYRASPHHQHSRHMQDPNQGQSMESARPE